jgi:predicted RNA-binding protein with PUA-like domain
MLQKTDSIAYLSHDSKKVDPGVVAIIEVVREAYPDHTQFERSSPYFDPKSTADNPTWHMVDVKLKRKLKRTISLYELKALKDVPKNQLNNIALFKQSRLSISPLTETEYNYILSLEEEEPIVGGKSTPKQNKAESDKIKQATQKRKTSDLSQPRSKRIRANTTK